MPFFEIELPLGALNPELMEAALEDSGALSITLLDRGDEPILEPKPGEVRLWSDTLVRALFDDTHEPLAILRQVSELLGAETLREARIRAVEDQVWERVWLKDWSSRRFGERLWVVPTDAEAPPAADAVVVRLDPGLAFGTGSHPTTALCLELLDSLELAGQQVIDFGCGSGILGIAALKLGAAHVTAVDIDPQALTATLGNAALNAVADRLSVQGAESPLRPAHCVLANILAGPLIELAPTLRDATLQGGTLVLSGLISGQLNAVRSAYAGSFDMVSSLRDDWCCISARRRI
jgi:ribosomal protein L11 methyltransferase